MKEKKDTKKAAIKEKKDGPKRAEARAPQTLTWGSNSNNHFDISLAMYTHVARRHPAPSQQLTRIGSGRTDNG